MEKRKTVALLAGAAVVAALSLGCQGVGGANPPAAQSPPAAVNAAAESVRAIVAEEPESYSATLRLSAESSDGSAAVFSNIEADVARRGRDRRVSFRLPGGERVVYLSRGGARYVLLPDRERYAKVTSRETGFELPRLLMPDELVDHLKEQRGYARAGEEELNGRTVVKYVASGASRTGARATGVADGSVVYVDKLTGLPLRAELIAESADGVRGVKVVVEMRNVRTGAERDLFAVPRRMRKVEPEKVRGQVSSLVGTAAGAAGEVLNQTSDAAADTSASALR